MLCAWCYLRCFDLRSGFEHRELACTLVRTVNFTDTGVASSTVLPAGYKGLNWVNTFMLDAAGSVGELQCGHMRAAVSTLKWKDGPTRATLYWSAGLAAGWATATSAQSIAFNGYGDSTTFEPADPACTMDVSRRYLQSQKGRH